MTKIEIQAEIDRLIDIVRYSPSGPANVAAMKVAGLKRQLAAEEHEAEQKENNK